MISGLAAKINSHPCYGLNRMMVTTAVMRILTLIMEMMMGIRER